MNFGVSIVFFAVWPGGRRCANCRDAHVFERYCDESIFTWKTFKTTMEKTKKNQTHGQGLGEAWQGTWVWTFCFFGFSMVFCSLAKLLENTKKKVQTHGQGLGYPHTNQKNKKPKNQETKKPKNQKKQKKQDCTPQGEGVRCRVLGLVFLFFFFLFFWFFVFLVFGFFGFLVCVWIAIADVPSRDCQALSVVALEVGQAKTKKTKNQETKKTKNQKNKKAKKNKIAHPKGRGSDAECWVLSFFFFVFFFFLFFFGFLFFFFVFCFFCFLFFCFFGLCVDSHCRCAKQRLPGIVSGCTRSKVDTLQYSNVCYDIVHSANEQQRGMEFNFVRLRHMLLDLCTGNAAICALPQWPVLKKYYLNAHITYISINIYVNVFLFHLYTTNSVSVHYSYVILLYLWVQQHREYRAWQKTLKNKTKPEQTKKTN